MSTTPQEQTAGQKRSRETDGDEPAAKRALTYEEMEKLSLKQLRDACSDDAATRLALKSAGDAFVESSQKIVADTLRANDILRRELAKASELLERARDITLTVRNAVRGGKPGHAAEDEDLLANYLDEFAPQYCAPERALALQRISTRKQLAASSMSACKILAAGPESDGFYHIVWPWHEPERLTRPQVMALIDGVAADEAMVTRSDAEAERLELVRHYFARLRSEQPDHEDLEIKAKMLCTLAEDVAADLGAIHGHLE